MALEYDWYGDADIDVTALREFIAVASGGVQHSDGTVFLDGMYISARQADPEDRNSAIALFHMDYRFSATFHLANLASEATTTHNTALMVHVLIAFAQQHGGNGILLFNGEEAVLQYGADGITFDADWEDWTENAEVAPLLTQFTSAVLPQPLL